MQTMDETVRLDAERLAALRARAEALREVQRAGQPLRAEAGQQALAAARTAARPLLAAVVDAYHGLCPPGYPVVEDNRIEGAGGSIGVRFSRWHAFFVSLDNVRKRKPEEPKADAVARAAGVRLKRLPGEPLPPPDPNVTLELATQALRWDDDRGWVEMRHVLPSNWDPAMIEEHLAGYLIGLNYDLGAGITGP
jgi:hypothetical protein